MRKTGTENLNAVEVEFELDDADNQGDEEEFDETLAELQVAQARRTARSEIEIRRELIELRKVTGEYYDKDIFN